MKNKVLRSLATIATLAVILVGVMVSVTGCREAERVSYNISNEADSCARVEIVREGKNDE